MKLILFDIDSTLVRVARPVTNALIRTILSDAFDYHDDIVGYELHGKTDRMILRELGTIAGNNRVEDAAAMELMAEMIIEYWRTHLNASTLSLLPGAVPLLESLIDRDDVALGILTGNLKDGAQIKLSIHNLEGYFGFGAYGSDSEVRNDLPPIALERARAHLSSEFEYSSTLMIGDSHRDIECARLWDIRTVAVATGSLSADELRSHSPFAVIESLLDRAPIDAFLAE